MQGWVTGAWCRRVAALACAAGAAAGSPAALATEAADVLRLDFGYPTLVEPGYVSIGGGSHDDHRVAWTGAALGLRDRGAPDLLRRDFVFGTRGELLVGLDNGHYELRLVVGDRDFAHGPFDLWVQGQRAAAGVVTAAGTHRTIDVTTEVTDERLSLRFEGRFALNALVVRGPAQQVQHTLFGPPPPLVSPTPAELAAVGPADPRAALRAACEWILAQRRADAFLEVNSREWYRSAYPMLTLLAGFEIFGDRRYLRAVTDLLDKLVGEQLPNGAWSSTFADQPVATRTPAELLHAMGWTTNTADTGTVATCLSVASRYVDGPRRRSYIEAHRRYADEYAARFRLPSGAFTNGRWQGQDMVVPYSVATGTQAMSFAALHAATGDPRYLEIAERAVDWLLADNWLPDGRVRSFHHDSASSWVEAATAFGNLHYYHDGILWVWHWTRDEALRDRIRQAYARHVHGTYGLLATRQHEVWWPPTPRPWENSKAGGIPRVLLTMARDLPWDAALSLAVERCAAFLSRREWAERIGVLSDPRPVWGEFAVPATGFAGLTLAELVAPGVIYLRGADPDDRRSPAGPAAYIRSVKRRPASAP